MAILDSIYTYVFGRKRFAKLNRALFRLSLHGLGVLNYEGRSSGETWFIRRILATKEPVVVFDVGANVGSYAREILETCVNARIFAFEPHPANFAKLAEVGGISSHNLALGDQESMLELFDYAGAADGSQHASLFKAVIEEIHHGKSTSHQVRCMRMDDFCQQNGIDVIDFLKIDTEGNELAVLHGAKKLLESGKIKMIQFEFNEMNIVSRVYMRDFVDLLQGYKFFRLLPSGLLSMSYSPLSSEVFAFQNIVAISRSATFVGVSGKLARILKRR